MQYQDWMPVGYGVENVDVRERTERELIETPSENPFAFRSRKAGLFDLLVQLLHGGYGLLAQIHLIEVGSQQGEMHVHIIESGTCVFALQVHTLLGVETFELIVDAYDLAVEDSYTIRIRMLRIHGLDIAVFNDGIQLDHRPLPLDSASTAPRSHDERLPASLSDSCDAGRRSQVSAQLSFML